MSVKFEWFLLMACFVHVVPISAQKRPVNVPDCVSVKKIVREIDREVRISPDGRHVAYILEAPNLITNQNDYELRVRDLGQTSHLENGSLVFQSTDLISGLTWLTDGKRVALIARSFKDRSKILFVNTETRDMESVVEVPNGVGQYSVNATGELVAYTTNLRITSPARTAEDKTRGFSIPPNFFSKTLAEHHPAFSFFDRCAIVVMNRTQTGKWD
jgi:hypothetical protein